MVKRRIKKVTWLQNYQNLEDSLTEVTIIPQNTPLTICQMNF